VAVLIVDGAFALVTQDIPGFFRFLELGFSRIVTGVAIRVVLHCQSAIRFLQRGLVASLGDTEDLVIIAF